MTFAALEVRPRLSSAGLVNLEIMQEVSSIVSTTTSGIDSPTIAAAAIYPAVLFPMASAVL